MEQLERIKKIIKEHKEELRSSYKVKEIGIFGSFVKGEEQKESDLDILVEFEQPVDLFTFLDLEEYLTKLINLKVDLVMKKTLKPHIGKKVLQEAVYV